MRIELRRQSDFWAGINAVCLLNNIISTIRSWWNGEQWWFLVFAALSVLFGVIVYNDLAAKDTTP